MRVVAMLDHLPLQRKTDATEAAPVSFLILPKLDRISFIRKLHPGRSSGTSAFHRALQALHGLFPCGRQGTLR